MRYKLYAVIIICLLTPLSSSFGEDCRKATISVYFGNGMFNSREDAHQSRLALQRSLIVSELVFEREGVHTAYNLIESALEELLQVAAQKNEEYGRMFWRYLSDLSIAPEEFRQIARETANEFDQSRYLHDADLRRHVSSYRAEIQAGKSVLVVAHSQGNFYANAAWNILRENLNLSDQMSIVGVAAPVSEIAGDGPYTTLTQDLIVAAIRHVGRALPANVTNSKSSPSGHEFVSQYLEGSKSGPKIISDIHDAIKQLQVSASGPADLSDSAYIHPSLIAFWQYVRRIRDKAVKFSDSECLAISSFAKTYDWWGESCEERSLPALTKWMSACYKQWSEKDRFDFDRCSLLGDGSISDPGLGSSRAFDFILVSHPECIWHGADVRRHITPAVLSEAQAWLRTPPSAQ